MAARTLVARPINFSFMFVAACWSWNSAKRVAISPRAEWIRFATRIASKKEFRLNAMLKIISTGLLVLKS